MSSYITELKQTMGMNRDFLSKTASPAPVNLFNGKFFSAINSINLSLQNKGSFWATYDNITQNEGRINKGSKATKVENWRKTEEGYDFFNMGFFSVEKETNLNVDSPTSLVDQKDIADKLGLDSLSSENITNMFEEKFKNLPKNKEIVSELSSYLLESKLNHFVSPIERDKNIALEGITINDFRKMSSMADKASRDVFKKLDLPNINITSSIESQPLKREFFLRVADTERAQNEFVKLAQDIGLEVNHNSLIADGKINNVFTDGQKNRNQKSGRYKLHLDGVPNGWLKNWQTGQEVNYMYSFEKGEQQAIHLTAKTEILKKQQEKKAEIEQQKRVAHQQVKKTVFAVENADKKPSLDNPYLVKKGITEATGIYEDSYHKNTLLIPVKNVEGDAVGIQKIFQNQKGDTVKIYQEGSKPQGGFHVQGQSLEKADEIILTEGYATTNSVLALHPNKENVAAVTFFSGSNFKEVFKAIEEKYPDKQKTFFADNDYHLEELNKNPNVNHTKSVEYGEKILKEYDGNKLNIVEAPHNFANPDLTDFNDFKALNEEFTKEYIHSSVKYFSGNDETKISNVFITKDIAKFPKPNQPNQSRTELANER